MGNFVAGAKLQLDELTTELDAAEGSCKELAKYLVEESLKDEPEKFLSELQSFVVSFEKADRYNRELGILEAKKKKREEDAAKRAKEHKATGAEVDKENHIDAAKKVALNRALMQKVGIQNDRKNLIDGIESAMTNAGKQRVRRHAPAVSK